LGIGATQKTRIPPQSARHNRAMAKRRTTRHRSDPATNLAWDAGMVMALRLGQLGLGIAPEGERDRMVDEKAPAFLKAQQAAIRAAFRHPFDPVAQYHAMASAYTSSLRGKVRANKKRLTKLG
jgi:hypothetical protein